MSNPNWLSQAQNVKNLNKHVVIDLIRFTSGGVARVDLARELGLTRAAVTAIVDDLLAMELVREVEGHRPAGRKPIVLDINPDRSRVIGIDMGATHVTMVLADCSARVLREEEEPLSIHEGPEICLRIVNRLVNRVLSEEGITLDQIGAVGVGVPGPVIAETGVVSGPPIMPGWDGYPIKDSLQNLWHCPVSVSNDAELGALGEWAYGVGREVNNVVYIKVGTGIGAGLLLNGQIYRGVTGTAGEIGHITIDEDGPVCTCGNRGCLEAVAGGGAIAKRAVTAIQHGQRTRLVDIHPVERITARDVVAAARRGDLFAQQLITDAGRHLGTAIASLVNLVNPEMVVIGGGMSQCGDLLLDPIRRTVNQRSLIVASKAVRVTASLLGRRSSGMGAVVQALSIVLHKYVDVN